MPNPVIKNIKIQDQSGKYNIADIGAEAKNVILANGNSVEDVLGTGGSLDDKQNKTLDTPLTIDGTQETTVEGALGALNTSKQDSLTEGAGIDITNGIISVDADVSLSSTAETPVQNKVIKAELDLKQNKTLDNSITIDGTSITTVEGALTALNTSKQSALTAGDGIDITNGIISVDADNALSATAETPVQNKVIKTELDLKQNINLSTSININGTNATTVEQALSALNTNKQGNLSAGDGIDIANGIISVDADAALSSTATTPVQNKIVKNALDAKQNINLSTSINIGSTTATTVEGALNALNTNKQSALTPGAGIDINSGTISVNADAALSSSATTPVQNKVVKNALDTKQNINLSTAITIDGTSATTVEGALSTLNTKKLNVSLKGVANGIAELDNTGKVPISQIPGGVSLLEKYATRNDFPAQGDENTLYVALDTNFVYRWTGVSYVQIDASIQLGETHATAYYGDRGKIAYDHSQAQHARVDATKVEASTTNGKIKINGTDTPVYTLGNHASINTTYGIGDASNYGHVKVDTVPTTGSTNAVSSNGVLTALTNGTVTKIGTANVGTTNKPIYLSSGVPTVCNEYIPTNHASINTTYGVGNTNNYGHVKVDATPTAGSTNTVSSGGVLTALTNGTVTKIGTTTLGDTNKPIYLNAGVPTLCNEFAPKSHATSNTTYGVATTTNYGHVKFGTASGTACEGNDSRLKNFTVSGEKLVISSI